MSKHQRGNGRGSRDAGFWICFLFLAVMLSADSALAQSVSVSTNAVEEGQTVVTSWSGFPGNVNVEVWKGNQKWVDANTNVSGSGSQNLVTTAWEIRGDYRVKIVLRSNTSINAYSSYFSVSDPQVSVNTTYVSEGQTVVASWSGFSGNVNIEVWKGGSLWQYANTNVSGTGSQNLVTTGWEARSDYRVRVVLRDKVTINRSSNYIQVIEPMISLSTTLVDVGEPVIVYWSGFASNVNIEVWKGGSLWEYANTNVGGSGSQYLYTTDWEPRSDYRVKVILRADPTVNISSVYFSVTANVPDPPGLSFPSSYNIYNRDTQGSVWFGWSDVPGAYEYWLNIFPDGQSWNPVFDGQVLDFQKEIPINSSWQTGIYIWQVKVRTAGGWSDYSNARQFIVDVPPPAPTISGPAEGSIFNPGDAPTFTWSGPSGVTVARYYLRLVPGNDLNGSPVFDLEPAFSGQSVTLDASGYAAGDYIWGVRAIKVTPAGYSQSLYEWRFRISCG